jgi:hypothetical protein
VSTAVTAWGLVVGAEPAMAVAVPEGLAGLVLVDGEVVTSARAVAALPEEVDVVVELDATMLDAWDPRLVAELLDALGGDGELGGHGALGAADGPRAGGRAAVTASAPMADALKRVDGERVVGGLARDGLHVPRLPRAYRRRALAQVSASWAAQDPHTDGALLVALRAAGAGVAMLLTDGTVVELDAAQVPAEEVAP